MLNDSTVQFTNQTTSSTNATYQWDFGDGTTSTSSATTVSKTYNFDGNYTVSLKATNACGDNYYIANVRVCKKAIPSQTVTLSGCGTVNVNASATRNGARYQWDFGNGTVLPATPSTNPIISYTYTNPGTYNIKLTVITANNCDTATLVSPVTITSSAVVPNNNWSFTSDDLSFNFSRAAVTNATSYSWNFGDGTTSNLQNPGNKVYATPGVYTITLTASNNCSNHTFTAQLNVPHYKTINNTPNASFREVIAFSTQQIYYLGNNGKLYTTDTAGNWSSAINLPSNLTFNDETHLFKDINNNLWIYGKNEVAKFNPATMTWTSFYSTTGFGNNKTIDAMTIDNAGNLWTVGDKQIRRNSTVISNSNNNQFSSIAFAPATGRVWITASNRNSLYYVNANSNTLNSVDGTGILNGGDAIKVHATGDLFVATETGIIRTNGVGSPITNYNALSTGAVLSGAPTTFDFDNEGNLWVVRAGKLIKIPINNAAAAKSYSINSDLNAISYLSVLNVAGADNDIMISKTTTNGAIQIK